MFSFQVRNTYTYVHVCTHIHNVYTHMHEFTLHTYSRAHTSPFSVEWSDVEDTLTYVV